MAGIRKSHFHYLSARASAKQQGATQQSPLGQCRRTETTRASERARLSLQRAKCSRRHRLINEKFPAANLTDWLRSAFNPLLLICFLLTIPTESLPTPCGHERDAEQKKNKLHIELQKISARSLPDISNQFETLLKIAAWLLFCRHSIILIITGLFGYYIFTVRTFG